MKIEDWRLEIFDWRLEIFDWRLEIFDLTKLQRGRADMLYLRLVESLLMRNWIVIRLESISEVRSTPLSSAVSPRRTYLK